MYRAMERVWPSMSEPEIRRWALAVTAYDVRMNEIAQKEERLYKEFNELRRKRETDQLSREEIQRKETLAQELNSLCLDYPRQQVRLWELEDNLPCGGWRMGYFAHCSRDGPHLNSGSIWRCVSFGGCCSRQCGCCSKPRGGRLGRLGHCTFECQCCRNRGGYDWTVEDLCIVKPDFDSMVYPTNTRILDEISFHFWGKRALA